MPPTTHLPRVLDAKRPSKRKRTFRCRIAPVQARLRKGGYSDRAAPTRVLREADAGAQAQEGRCHQAAYEAQCADDVTAKTPLLIRKEQIRKADPVSVLCLSRAA